MSVPVLATDYDGTIAHDGVVDRVTFNALSRLRSSGWRLVLVTGRELGDVQRLMPRLDVFDRVVAENGAVLHTPATGATRLLASPPGPGLAEALAAAGVQPIQCGQVVVATWASHEAQVLSVLAALGLPWRVVHNKGALMALPPGVDKRSGILGGAPRTRGAFGPLRGRGRCGERPGPPGGVRPAGGGRQRFAGCETSRCPGAACRAERRHCRTG